MLTCVGSGCQQQIAEVELAVVVSNRAKDMVSVTLQELQCKHAEVDTEDLACAQMLRSGSILEGRLC